MALESLPCDVQCRIIAHVPDHATCCALRAAWPRLARELLPVRVEPRLVSDHSGRIVFAPWVWPPHGPQHYLSSVEARSWIEKGQLPVRVWYDRSWHDLHLPRLGCLTEALFARIIELCAAGTPKHA